MQQNRLGKLFKARGMVSMLALLLLGFLGLCGGQAAQAQSVRIEPVTGILDNTTARANENIDPQFRLVLSNGAANVNYFVTVTTAPVANAAGDSPTPDADYDPRSVERTYTLNTGNATPIITLDVYDDESFEQLPNNRPSFAFDEQVQLTISSGTAIDAGRASVTYGIIDNDTRPLIRVRGVQTAVADNTSEARFVEGNSGQNPGAFTVELIGGTSGQSGFRNNQNTLIRTTSIEGVTFDYDYLSGDGTDPTSPTQDESQRAPNSAALGADFAGSFDNSAAAPPGAPGQIPINTSFTTIPFTTIGDTQDENNEAFIVRILNPRNTANPNGLSSVSNPAGTQDFGVILDDDAPNVTVSSPSVTEVDLGDSNTVTFRVELSAPSPQPIYIDYFTQDISAISFTLGPNTVPDYQGTGGTLLFPPNTTVQNVTVTVNGDNIAEGTEQFRLRLQPNNGLLYNNPVNPRSITNAFFNDLVPETVQRGLTFTGGNAGGVNATATIIDNDTTSVSIEDVTVTESDAGTVANFRVSLSRRSQNAVTVTATTSQSPSVVVGGNDIATPDVDFVSQSQTVTIAGGATEAIFQVQIIGDTTDERNEEFQVNLTNPNAIAVLGDAQAVGTIIDDDGPMITVIDPNSPVPPAVQPPAQVYEGDSGITPFVFTVLLSAVSPQDITVTYRTADGDPNAGGAVSTGTNPDFQAISTTPTATLTIPAGQTKGTITVNVNGDNIFENNGNPETFSVVLTGATNATIAATTATGSIAANATAANGVVEVDSAPPVVSINGTVDVATGVSNVTATEGSPVSFTASLTTGVPMAANPALPVRSDKLISVQYRTDAQSAANTATPGVDFTAVNNGVVVFNAASATLAGETSKPIVVNTIDDNIDEINENFTVTLTNLTAGAPATISPTKATGTATIIDNEGPNVSIAPNASVVEGNSAGTNLTFVITLSAASPQPITLSYTTSDVTATSPADYTGVTSGTFTIPANTTSFNLLIPVVGDLIDEDNETFTVTLNNPDTRQATITNGTSTGTIIDDDTASVNVTPVVGTTTEAGGTATFSVNLNSKPTANVVISLLSNDASEGTVSPASFTFTPTNFAAPQTATVTGVNDNFDDGDVTYSIVTSASSADPRYDNIAVPDVMLTNIDDDNATLTLTLGAPSIPENGGGTIGTVTRNIEAAQASAPLTVTLTNTNPNAVTIPASITIPAGQSSATFNITPINNTLSDGTRTATITATAGALTNSQTLTITDDDNSSLLVTVNPSSTIEGGAPITGTVTRNTVGAANNAALTVTLQSSDVGEATVPASVTIPAGQTAANFAITPINDNIADDAQNVTITASANGFTLGTASVVINDNNARAFVADDFAQPHR